MPADLSAELLVVGHDLWMVKHTDIAIVDAPTKIGTDTAQEMIMAKYFNKPLISIIPKEAHHRKSNITFHGIIIADWIHPFLHISSDAVVENIEEAIVWIKQYMKKPEAIKIKDFSVFENAIETFEKKMPEVYKSYVKKGW